MRKYIFLVALVALAVVVPIASAANLFTKDLSFGFTNDSEVSKLQELLTDQGCYNGPISGNFYSLTLKGVKCFQAKNGIVPAAGYFGPKSRVIANKIISKDTDASDAQAVSETGSKPIVAAQDLQRQLDALLAQLKEMQDAQSRAHQPSQLTPVSPQPSQIPVPQQTAPTPIPISKASMEIFSPVASKGLGRTYKANDYKLNPDSSLTAGSVAPDDSNSIDLGLIVRNDNGDAVLKYDVTIEATDPPTADCGVCKRFIKGTGTDQTGIGSIGKIYKDGIAETVSFYGFHYEFKTVGQHTITFSANGMTKSVTLTAN